MNPNPKQKRQKDKAYLTYIEANFCLGGHHGCIGDIVAHHTVSRGAGGSDYLAVPLCVLLHNEVHFGGAESFQAYYEIDFKTEIIRLLKAYPKQNKEIKELLKELEGALNAK